MPVNGDGMAQGHALQSMGVLLSGNLAYSLHQKVLIGGVIWVMAERALVGIQVTEGWLPYGCNPLRRGMP